MHLLSTYVTVICSSIVLDFEYVTVVLVNRVNFLRSHCLGFIRAINLHITVYRSHTSPLYCRQTSVTAKPIRW